MAEKSKDIVGSLQKQAWRRATQLPKPNSGTPHDWEDYEKMTKPQAQQKPIDKELEKKKKEQAQDRRNG